MTNVREAGSVTVIGAALIGLAAVLAVVIAAVGQVAVSWQQALIAADAAALASAPMTFWVDDPAAPREEAARFAELNGARLVSCDCGIDSSWDPRTVEVVVAVDLVGLGWREVRATSVAEYLPLGR